MNGFDNWELSLCHYGIKGQRWGIRRYQNSDGTLTPEGKERYQKTRDDLLAARDQIEKIKPGFFRTEKSNIIWQTKLGKRIWELPRHISDRGEYYAREFFTKKEVLADHANRFLGRTPSKRQIKALESATQKRIDGRKIAANTSIETVLDEISKLPKRKQDYYRAALYESLSSPFQSLPDYEPWEVVNELKK